LLDKGWDLGPLTTALHSRGKNALRPREKKQLLLSFAGTGDKFMSGNCVKCNQPDSIHHRLVECESEEALHHRDELLDPETNKGSGACTKFLCNLAEHDHNLARTRT